MAPSREPVIRQSKSQTNSQTASWNREGRDKRVRIKVMHARNITRPQLKFKDKIDNSNLPFVHRLTWRPNCLVRDGEREGKEATIDEFVRKLREGGGDEKSGRVFESDTHPYEREIREFRPRERELQPVEMNVSRLDAMLAWREGYVCAYWSLSF